MKPVLVRLIRFYQLVFSPWFGSQCRFYPTCSEYARVSILEHGSFRGSGLAIRRLLKCHPWHGGGVDLVPATESHVGEMLNEKD